MRKLFTAASFETVIGICTATILVSFSIFVVFIVGFTIVGLLAGTVQMK